MSTNSLNEYPNVNTKSKTKWWLWILGGSIICICLACAGSIGFFRYFGQEAKDLSISYSMPLFTVKKGENFDLVLNLTNTGNRPFTVNKILLDEVIGHSFLDGAIVLTTEPKMERDYSINGRKAFIYNQTLQPGETQKIIFHIQATMVGEFTGSIRIFVGNKSKAIKDMELIVQE